MLKCVLQQNREDRVRYVSLVTYEQRWLPVGDGEEILTLVPIRRTWQWVLPPKEAQNQEGAFVCTRVTELRFRDVRAQPAHREFMEQWLKHVKAQLARIKNGARAIKVEVVP